MRLRQLQQTVTATLAEAKIEAKPQGNQGTLRDRLDDLDKKLQEVTNLVSASNDQIQKAKMEGREADGKAKNAKQVIYDARTALKVRSTKYDGYKTDIALFQQRLMHRNLLQNHILISGC